MAIDHFQGGSQSARDKLNRLVDEANAIGPLRGDEQFIAVRKGPGGTTVSLNIGNVLARMPRTSGGGGVFPVLVTGSAGDAGSASAACSFTYSISDLAGNALGTGLTPVFNLRGSAGLMVAAPNGSYALAFNAGAILILWMTTEQPATGNCPS